MATGTGQTHVATIIGVQAIAHHRKKARFFSTVDLVILDEPGHLPFRASGGAQLVHLLEPNSASAAAL